MGWAADQRARDAERHRLEREEDRARHRAEREEDRERRQLESLRMKALAEQAKGKPGVWTAEYETKLSEIQAREEEMRARQADAEARALALAAAEAARAEATRLENVRRADERRASEAKTFKVILALIVALTVIFFGVGLVGQFVADDPPGKPARTVPRKR